MIAELSPIRYACVARSGVILAGEFSGGESAVTEKEEVTALAARCVEAPPAYHRNYTETARGTTKSFLMEGPFVFFAVHPDSITRADGLRFLAGFKSAFLKLVKSGPERVSAGAYQTDFGPILRYLMQTPPTLSGSGVDDDRRVNWECVDVACGEAAGLFGRPAKYEKIRRSDDADAGGDIAVDGVDRECDSSPETDTRERAKRAFRRQVKVIIAIDSLICVVLFCIWLWICEGFRCINV